MATNNDNNGQSIVNNSVPKREDYVKGEFNSILDSATKKLASSIEDITDRLEQFSDETAKGLKEFYKTADKVNNYSKQLSDKQLLAQKASEKEKKYNDEREELEKSFNKKLKQLNKIKEDEINALDENIAKQRAQLQKELEDAKTKRIEQLRANKTSRKQIKSLEADLTKSIDEVLNAFDKSEAERRQADKKHLEEVFEKTLKDETDRHTKQMSFLEQEHKKSEKQLREEEATRKRNEARQEALLKKQQAFFESKQKTSAKGVYDTITKNNTESSDIFSSLKKTMNELTEANNTTIESRTHSGNIMTLLGKTILSAFTKGLTLWTDTKLNLYVKNITDGITELQSSYSTTGMEISKALYLDRDEIKKMYGGFADELVEDGFDKATSEIKVAEQANSLAGMGITDEDMLRGMSVAMTEANLMTGGQLTFNTEDQVKDYYNQYEQLLEQNGNDVTATNEAFKKVMMDQASYWVNTTKEYGNGIGLANGKFTEMANQAGDLAERIHASNPDIDTESIRKQIMSAYTATAGTLGDIAPNLIETTQNTISKLSNEEYSGEILSLLSGTTHYEQIADSISNNDFGSAYTNMIQGAMELYSKGEGTTALYNYLGLNGTEMAKIANKFSDEEGNFATDALATAINTGYNKNMEGSDSQDFINALNGIKTDTGTTIEQSKKNEALNNEAMDIWGEIPTDLADGDKMIVSSIELLSNTLKDCIDSGIELVITSITSGNIINAFSSSGVGAGFGAGGAAGATGGSTGFLAGVKGAGFLGAAGTILGAAGIGASIGYAIGTPIAAAIDSATDAINVIGEQAGFDKMTEVVSGKIDDTKNAINNVSDTIKESLNDDTLELFESEDFQNKIAEQFSASSADVFKDTLKDINQGEDAITKDGKKVDLSKMSKDEAWQVVKDAKNEKNGYSFSGGDSTESRNSIFSDYQVAFKSYDNNLSASIDAIAGNAVLTGSSMDDAWQYYKLAREENGDEVTDKDKKQFEKTYTNTQKAKEYYDDFVERSKYDLYAVYEDAIYYKDHGDGTNENKSLSWSKAWDKAWKEATEGEDAYIGDSDILEYHTEGAKPEEGKDFTISNGELIINSGVGFTSNGTNDYLIYNPKFWGKYETGLNNVPYDDFPALLHKGERVLTAADADLLDTSNDISNGILNNKFRTLVNNSIENNTTNSNFDNCVEAINSQTVSVDKQLENIIKLLQLAVNSLTNNRKGSYTDYFNLSSIAQKTGDFVVSSGVSAIS